jgi:hypothetical protein
VTLFVDMDNKRVIFVTTGKGADVLQKFCQFLDSKGVLRSQIKDKLFFFCLDFSGQANRECAAYQPANNHLGYRVQNGETLSLPHGKGPFYSNPFPESNEIKYVVIIRFFFCQTTHLISHLNSYRVGAYFQE